MEERKETFKKVLVFLLITTVISSGIFVWMFMGARDSIAAVLPMMMTPGISAVVTALIFRDKISRFGWKPGKARFLLYAYFLPLIVSLIGYGLVWISKYSAFTPEQVQNYRWAEIIGFNLPAPFIAGFLSKMILASLLAIIPVLGEEVGWSGYLVPNLRKVFSVPLTSVIVGVYWSVWHYPAIIGGFYGWGTPLWVALPGFTLVLTGASFIRTVLVDRSGSLWTGVLLHTGHNVILMGIFLEMTVDTKGIVNYLVSETGVFLGLVYILVALVFWRILTRSTSLSGKRLPEG